MSKFKVYKWYEPVPGDGEKFFLPSKTDPTGYESLEDYIKRALAPDFIPSLIRDSQFDDGYTADQVLSDDSDNIFDEGLDIQDRSDFDLSLIHI